MRNTPSASITSNNYLSKWKASYTLDKFSNEITNPILTCELSCADDLIAAVIILRMYLARYFFKLQTMYSVEDLQDLQDVSFGIAVPD